MRALRQPRGSDSIRRRWPTLLLLPFLSLATGAAAQDCTTVSDWSDIQYFRHCLKDTGPANWMAPSGVTLLHVAAGLTRNPTIVILLLEAGFDPNARNDRGRTSLHYGAENPNPVVTSHLLAAGADPNAMSNTGDTPLHGAARNDNERVIKVLLDAGADPNAMSNTGYTPLHGVASNDNERVIKVLLDAGADPNALSNDGWTPFYSAVFFGRSASVFLDAGAGVGLTALHRAIVHGDSRTADSLLAQGADPNGADEYGWNALHFAVPKMDGRTVSHLLVAGADPNARTANGLTALHLAADRAVIAALAVGGAEIDVPNDLGRTPLHQAALFRTAPVVEALLDAGANIDFTDNEGNRPADLAERNYRIDENSDVMRRLRGSDTNRSR